MSDYELAVHYAGMRFDNDSPDVRPLVFAPQGARPCARMRDEEMVTGIRVRLATGEASPAWLPRSTHRRVLEANVGLSLYQSSTFAGLY